MSFSTVNESPRDTCTNDNLSFAQGNEDDEERPLARVDGIPVTSFTGVDDENSAITRRSVLQRIYDSFFDAPIIYCWGCIENQPNQLAHPCLETTYTEDLLTSHLGRFLLKTISHSDLVFLTREHVRRQLRRYNIERDNPQQEPPTLSLHILTNLWTAFVTQRRTSCLACRSDDHILFEHTCTITDIEKLLYNTGHDHLYWYLLEVMSHRDLVDLTIVSNQGVSWELVRGIQTSARHCD